jgi:hypothetical protein
MIISFLCCVCFARNVILRRLLSKGCARLAAGLRKLTLKVIISINYRLMDAKQLEGKDTH